MDLRGPACDRVAGRSGSGRHTYRDVAGAGSRAISDRHRGSRWHQPERGGLRKQNLATAEAREIARKIIKHSDFVTENFTVGNMAKYGLGYEDLVKIKSDIIML